MLVTEPARDGGKIVTGRKGVARFEVFIKGVPAHAGTRPEDGRSAIRELANVIQTLEAMNDLKRGVTVNVGVVRGGTQAERHRRKRPMPRSTCACRRSPMPTISSPRSST